MNDMNEKKDLKQREIMDRIIKIFVDNQLTYNDATDILYRTPGYMGKIKLSVNDF
jgi:hypothetical protein